MLLVYTDCLKLQAIRVITSNYESSEESPNQPQGNGETTETIQEQSEGEPDSVQQDTVTGDLDQRHVNILSERNMAQTSQLKQAAWTVQRSRVEMVAGKVGDNVAVPIPLVDRGRGDPRNILGIVLDRNEDDLYTMHLRERWDS